jgi:hypothetical protein
MLLCRTGIAPTLATRLTVRTLTTVTTTTTTTTTTPTTESEEPPRVLPHVDPRFQYGDVIIIHDSKGERRLIGPLRVSFLEEFFALHYFDRYILEGLEGLEGLDGPGIFSRASTDQAPPSFF